MSKRIFIDASNTDETRVAVTLNEKLDDYEIETGKKNAVKGDVFLAKITSSSQFPNLTWRRMTRLRKYSLVKSKPPPQRVNKIKNPRLTSPTRLKTMNPPTNTPMMMSVLAYCFRERKIVFFFESLENSKTSVKPI